MRDLTRRDFIKLCAGTATALGMVGAGWPGLAEAVRPLAGGGVPVLWLRGSACSGCSASMINTAAPGIRELLTEIVQMSWHAGLETGSGTSVTNNLMQLAEANKGKFILVVEGAIPKGENGRFNIMGRSGDGRTVTFLEMVEQLGQKARQVLAVGSCAAFGGLPAAEPNLMKCVRTENVVDADKVINIPGCPPHPDWIVASLLHVVLYGKPEIDDFGRPKVFYGGLIHNNCPRRQYFDNSIFAENFGEEGCLLELGCKGPLTHGDCSTRLWNRGRNWCVGGEGPCLGCSEPSFPQLMAPFYARMPDISVPGIQSTPDTIGLTLAAAAGVGLAAHLAGNVLTGRVGLGGIGTSVRAKAEARAAAKRKAAASEPVSEPASESASVPEKDGDA